LGNSSGVSEQDLFHETAHLRLHPDIAKAIAEGRDQHGRNEGHKINDFNAEHHLASYRAPVEEIAAGRADDRRCAMSGRRSVPGREVARNRRSSPAKAAR
jgi:hypothetical protein